MPNNSPLTTYIDKISVELEGIYLFKNINNTHNLGSNVAVKSDASIHLSEGIICTKYNGENVNMERTNIAFGLVPPDTHIDEMQLESRELIPLKPFVRISALKDWIKTYYPVAINRTCGFHIHTSFKSIKYYNNLMEEEFYDFFISKMEEFGEIIKRNESKEYYNLFVSRLRGKNRFARKVFIPEEQCKKRKGNYFRYTHLNFSYVDHNTIECRLFPMFENVETAFEAVDTLADIYTKYLDNIYSNGYGKKIIMSKYVPIYEKGDSGVHSDSV